MPLVPVIDQPVRRGIAASGLLCAVLLIATRIQNGANAAGHAVTEFLMPVGLLWLFLFAMAVVFFFKSKRRVCLLFVSAWIVLTLSFNMPVAIAFFGTIERPPTVALSADDLPLRAVVVLGGAATTNDYGVDELTMDGERVFSAAQLWHAGETKAVICTGKNRDPSMPVPGQVARRLLVSVGVPDAAIFVVGGEDTEDEMKCLTEWLRDPPNSFESTGRIGLITSAFHMDRAIRKAREVSLDLVPLPVAYRCYQSQTVSIQSLIPTTPAGELVRVALKEHLARLIGK
jgi:uncharacterized SAM-binding protein YcdF (DUF218 family)